MIHDVFATSPMVIVTLTGLLALMAGVFSPRGTSSGWLGAIVGAGFALALAATYWLSDQLPLALSTDAISGSLTLDAFGLTLGAVILVGAILTTWTAPEYLAEQDADHHEYYALIAFSTLGMMAMVTAADFLTLFVALEVMSIALYVLAGFKRQSPFAAEAALKYFILGSFASALLLLGVAFLYGVTGEISFSGVAKAFHFQDGLAQDGLAILAMVILFVSLAFKVAAVPFHMWTPDVYEGSMSSVTGFMAVGVKTAAFGAMARVGLTCFGDSAFVGEGAASGAIGWQGIVAILAAASIIGGNLMALAQTNLKRLLAYSAIAHTGYLLVGILATTGGSSGDSPNLALGGGLVFYLLAYTLANAAAFGVAAAVSGGKREDLQESAYQGLAKKDPALGFVLAVSMFSLLGIPATAGFIGKLTIFTEVMSQPDQPWLWLIILAAIGSIVSAWYYLRVILVAFMKDEDPADPIRLVTSSSLRRSVLIATALTLLLGVLPGTALDVAQDAGESLAQTTAPGLSAVHPASPPVLAPVDLSQSQVTEP